MAGKIAGIILAGGQSSRMGRDKAKLVYQGRNLLDLMAEKVGACGVSEVLVSGEAAGYRCLADETPWQGPARAILGMAKRLGEFNAALFVPVDMPLMTGSLLNVLLQSKAGGFYARHFLPACIPLQSLTPELERDFVGQNLSVEKLLQAAGVLEFPVRPEDEGFFLNVNTPDDYKKLSG